MKVRFLILYMVIFSALGAVICVMIAGGSKQDTVSYPTEINRLVIRLSENLETTSDEPFDYAVIDQEGNLLYAKSTDLNVVSI